MTLKSSTALDDGSFVFNPRRGPLAAVLLETEPWLRFLGIEKKEREIKTERENKIKPVIQFEVVVCKFRRNSCRDVCWFKSHSSACFARTTKHFVPMNMMVIYRFENRNSILQFSL